MLKLKMAIAALLAAGPASSASAQYYGTSSSSRVIVVPYPAYAVPIYAAPSAYGYEGRGGHGGYSGGHHRDRASSGGVRLI
jgi:hypothetical protein